MEALAYPLTVLIVVAVPALAVCAVAAAARWGLWLWQAGAVGVAVLVVTGAAAVNLLVPRTCSTTTVAGQREREVNLPVLSIVLGDGPCFRAAMAQAQGAVLTGVAGSALVTMVLRRSRRAGAGAAPAAPTP